MTPATLYLLPTPLGETPVQPVPEYAAAIARSLKYFVVEKAKTARQALKAMGYQNLPEAEMIELNERTQANWKNFSACCSKANP